MTKKTITHVRISKDAARELHIIAKAYDQTTRQTLDAIIHAHFESMLEDTNAQATM